MIVLDASVVIDLLLDVRPVADEIRARVLAEADRPAVPTLLDAEVGQVLRRFVLREEVDAKRSRLAIVQSRSRSKPCM